MFFLVFFFFHLIDFPLCQKWIHLLKRRFQFPNCMREEVEAFKALAAANVLHGPNKFRDALCFCAAVFFL